MPEDIVEDVDLLETLGVSPRHMRKGIEVLDTGAINTKEIHKYIPDRRLAKVSAYVCLRTAYTLLDGYLQNDNEDPKTTKHHVLSAVKNLGATAACLGLACYSLYNTNLATKYIKRTLDFEKDVITVGKEALNKYGAEKVSRFNPDVKNYILYRISQRPLTGEQYYTKASIKALPALNYILFFGISDALRQGLRAIDYGQKAGNDLKKLGKEAWSCMYRKYKATKSRQLSDTTEESPAVAETSTTSKPSPAPGI